MAPSKRKAAAGDASSSTAPEKRQKKNVESAAPSTRSTRSSLAAASAPRSTRSSLSRDSPTVKNGKGRRRKSTKPEPPVNGAPAKETVSKVNKGKAKKTAKPDSDEEKTTAGSPRISVDVPQRQNSASQAKADHDRELEEHDDGPSYWLMKAEPESRIEKGKDVKFSIDDLKAATEPEGWDGVRNFVARNNMRVMMKGDLAFFYHSNCKAPGIVGTMEIVREHSDDATAFDPEHPYYDEKSNRDNPKWCLVHVEFRQKFPEIIKLKELQKYAKDGGILEHMQTLKQSRLSVSRVTKKEWDFIMGLVDMEDVAAASAQHQPNMLG